MQVETAHAPAQSDKGGTTHYFCSDHCRERFENMPLHSLSTITTP